MKNKSKDYKIGFLMGILICLFLYSCVNNPLAADMYDMGTYNNPMYVRIVE